MKEKSSVPLTPPPTLTLPLQDEGGGKGRGKGEGKNSSQSVIWWVIWIVLTIASFFLAAAFWTPIIARRLGTIHEPRTAVIWVAAVFGTWMAFLLPLIIVMYQKVDKAYEDARLRREKMALTFRCVLVDRAKRILPKALVERLKGVPPTLENGHLVSFLLKDGRKIPYAFVSGEEILGIYDFTEMPFEGKDVLEMNPVHDSNLPAFHTSNWLRLDGVQASEKK